MIRPNLARWTWLIILFGGIGAASADNSARGEAFATCAAYYFNATKARPMSEYEVLYSAGEQAVNEARRLTDAATVDRIMADASIEMTRLIDGDWHLFDRIEARHAAACQLLLDDARAAR